MLTKKLWFHHFKIFLKANQKTPFFYLPRYVASIHSVIIILKILPLVSKTDYKRYLPNLKFWTSISMCWITEKPHLLLLLSRSVLSDPVTPWTVAHQAPLSMGILQARTLEWVAMPSSRASSQPRFWTWVSCITDWFFTTEPAGEPQNYTYWRVMLKLQNI